MFNLVTLLQKDVGKLRKDMDVCRRDSRLPSFLFDDETQDLQQELAVVRGDYDKAKKVCAGPDLCNKEQTC